MLSRQPIDQLLRDQLDFFARLQADEYFADVKVLLEAKGVTENDIEQALSVLNEQGGKIGACVVILMPTLQPAEQDSPGPEGTVRLTVQVIEQPLFNNGDTGTGKAASAIALKVRDLGHYFATGHGQTYAFAGQEPVPVDEGRISYGVAFERPHRDVSTPKCATPMITPEEGDAPQAVVTIEAEAGATIYYTTNGAYPAPGITGAAVYSAPFAVTEPSIVRAVAYAPFKKASDVAQVIYGSAEDFGADFGDDFAN